MLLLVPGEGHRSRSDHITLLGVILGPQCPAAPVLSSPGTWSIKVLSKASCSMQLLQQCAKAGPNVLPSHRRRWAQAACAIPLAAAEGRTSLVSPLGGCCEHGHSLCAIKAAQKEQGQGQSPNKNPQHQPQVGIVSCFPTVKLSPFNLWLPSAFAVLGKVHVAPAGPEQAG